MLVPLHWWPKRLHTIFTMFFKLVNRLTSVAPSKFSRNPLFPQNSRPLYYILYAEFRENLAIDFWAKPKSNKLDIVVINEDLDLSKIKNNVRMIKKEFLLRLKFLVLWCHSGRYMFYQNQYSFPGFLKFPFGFILICWLNIRQTLLPRKNKSQAR